MLITDIIQDSLKKRRNLPQSRKKKSPTLSTIKELKCSCYIRSSQRRGAQPFHLQNISQNSRYLQRCTWREGRLFLGHGTCLRSPVIRRQTISTGPTSTKTRRYVTRPRPVAEPNERPKCLERRIQKFAKVCSNKHQQLQTLQLLIMRYDRKDLSALRMRWKLASLWLLQLSFQLATTQSWWKRAFSLTSNMCNRGTKDAECARSPSICNYWSTTSTWTQFGITRQK